MQSEHLARELACVHENHRPGEGRDRALAILALEATGDARHLPADHPLQAQLTLPTVGLAREQIANGAGESLLADLGGGGGRALGAVDRLPETTARRTAGRER